MALNQFSINGKTVWIEVADIKAEGGQTAGQDGQFQYTSASKKLADLAETLRDLIGAVTTPVQSALESSKPEEWSLEFNIGFKAETGLPFIAKGEANAAVKVTAKWK